MKPQTLLGFDYGKKRIGVAVGQTITATATALKTVAVNQGRPDWPMISALIAEWQPRQLIVGYPLTLAGERQAMTAAAERFSRQLKQRFQLTVDMMDECLSSVVARQELQSSYHLDPVAARLILESWLRTHGFIGDPKH